MDSEESNYIHRVRRFREDHLAVDQVDFLEAFEVISKMDWLESLTIRCWSDSSNVAEEDKIPFEFVNLLTCKSLKALTVSGARIRDLNSLSNFAMLRKLEMTGCQIEDFESISRLTQLESLILTYTAIVDLEPLMHLSNLKSLDVSASPNLTSLGSLTNLVHLEHLTARGCQELVNLGNLASLTALQVLDLTDCSNLEDFGPLADLKCLKILYLSGCGKLNGIGALGNNRTLVTLKIDRTLVENLLPLARIRSLRNLNCSNTKVTSLWPLSKHIRKGMEIPFGGGERWVHSIVEFDGCAIVDPPMDVAKRGRKAVLRYWRWGKDFSWYPRKSVRSCILFLRAYLIFWMVMAIFLRDNVRGGQKAAFGIFSE